MDSWVNDSFYSHFPSYSDQSRREFLAKARQLEYQNYLLRLADIDDLSSSRASKRDASSGMQSRRLRLPSVDVNKNLVDHSMSTEVPMAQKKQQDPFFIESYERDGLMNEIDTLDLPDIFNENVIKARNKQIAKVFQLFFIEIELFG